MYKIVRMHANPDSRRSTIDTGLTREEAREHCSRDDTHGGTYCFACRYEKKRGAYVSQQCPKCGSTSTGRAWFDGFEED